MKTTTTPPALAHWLVELARRCQSSALLESEAAR